jgi:hypothetical protein
LLLPNLVRLDFDPSLSRFESMREQASLLLIFLFALVSRCVGQEHVRSGLDFTLGFRFRSCCSSPSLGCSVRSQILAFVWASVCSSARSASRFSTQIFHRGGGCSVLLSIPLVHTPDRFFHHHQQIPVPSFGPAPHTSFLPVNKRFGFRLDLRSVNQLGQDNTQQFPFHETPVSHGSLASFCCILQQLQLASFAFWSGPELKWILRCMVLRVLLFFFLLSRTQSCLLYFDLCS